MRLSNFVLDIQTATVSSGEAEFRVDSVDPTTRQIKDDVYPFRGDVKSPLHIFQGGTQIATTECAYNLTGSFNNYAAGSSDLVFWAKMTPTAPTNAATSSVTTFAYRGDPTISREEIGGGVYGTMTCSDSPGAGDNASAQSDSGLFSFSTLATGGTPTDTSDQPFSISLWVKVDNLLTIQYLFGKEGYTGERPNEYRGYIENPTGQIYFKLEDETASHAIVSIMSVNSVIASTWYHIVFTYDGRGGSSAYDGMKMYIDGQAISTTADTEGGTYVGMQPDHTKPLYIGSRQDGTNELDGQIAEFAMWDGLLDADQVKAVYDASYLGTQQAHLDFYVSGSINRTEAVNNNSTLKMTGSLSAIPEYAHCYKWGVLMVGDSEFEG